MNAYIHSMGHYHPETLLENSFFDSLGIGSDAQWVMERTGIASRCSVLAPDDIRSLHQGSETLSTLRAAGRVPSIADIAEKSWQLLTQRLTEPADPDLVICGTSVPDFDIPANASSISARLGIKAFSIDANSACSSFITDLHLARGQIMSGLNKNIAIFNPERYSLRMDFADRNSCVLFGDGASAAYVSPTKLPGSLAVLDTIMISDPSGYDLVKIPDSELFSQNGKAVQKFAISKTIEATRALLDRNQLDAKQIDYFTGHQANLRMVMSAADRLGIDQEKHLFNVNTYGNQGAAGAPAVLSMNWDRFKASDKIVVAVVGSGLTWGAALLEKQG